MKKKLIDICRQENKPFGYYVETLAGSNPRLLYRVYQDGHQELVRGAGFDELDTRTLRNDLIAVGNDPLVSNREGAVPQTVISPSILFDELEVKRSDQQNAKLPEYPPPDLAPFSLKTLKNQLQSKLDLPGICRQRGDQARRCADRGAGEYRRVRRPESSRD